MYTNQVKERLKCGEAVIGSFLYIPSAKLAEYVGACGFDFIVIDQEHGPIGMETAEDMVRACELQTCTPIVRVPRLESHSILRALDIGAMGVHIPTVNTKEEAHRAVAYSRYAPLGNRGLAGVRAANYGLREGLSEYCQKANEEVLVVIHIEEREAIEHLDELLEVEGVDVYYLGPTDLSNSFGRPGKVDAELQEILDRAIVRIVNAGRVAGIISTDVKASQRYLSMGVRYLATHAMHFLSSGSRSFLKTVRGR